MNKTPLIPTRKGLETHTFKFRFEQSIEAYVTAGGNTVDAFHNFMEETITTSEAITNENLAGTAYRLFKNFLKSQKLQSKKGFKTSRPIIASFSIDGKTEQRDLKFSINDNRIEKKMNDLAELTIIMFSKPEAMHKTTFQSVLNDIVDVRLLVDKIVLETPEEKAAKKAKKAELKLIKDAKKASKMNTANVENAIEVPAETPSVVEEKVNA